MSALAPPRTRVPRLILAGGGTGGHVYPALAVLEQVEGERRWVGSLGGREEPLVRRAGIEFVGVPTGAVLGRGPLALTSSALRNLQGIGAARRAIRAFRPDVVFATGGYVSVPVVAAAWTLGLPTALFLPDVKPGLAVAALSRIVDRVACTAEETRRYLPPDKVVPTGYPVRPDLRAWGDRARARATLGLPADEPVLFVVGGSTGARSINRALVAALPRLLARALVIHMAGSHGIEEARRAQAGLDGQQRARYRVFEYLHDEYGPAMAAADLMVGRAGASVLGELPAFGLPAVLVPGRFAGGHQRHNADRLVAAGAAVRLDDDQMQQEGTLATTVLSLLDDPSRRRAMAAAARAIDRPDAAERIAALLAELASRGRR
ncbi:MAG TPA: UDP-N-acetylglucosamine--N-acetylmuramyl-(pentapeptide) pyrophosphoryl-undecaprenol N-acetylglucosamine transferase [Chloroflexota bacterium]